MGKVATTFKIMPTSPEVDMNNLISKVSEIMKIQDSKIEPIAFGLNSLTVMFVTEDSDGGIGELEDKINQIEEISDVELVSSTLI
ncbi:MAG: elongation factor 1-beta [DPANN group archaeon]|nr:elongation factor 1-beta [DPANN group archaeon]